MIMEIHLKIKDVVGQDEEKLIFMKEKVFCDELKFIKVNNVIR